MLPFRRFILSEYLSTFFRSKSGLVLDFKKKSFVDGMKILLSKMREKLYLKFEAKLLVLLMHAMSCLGVHVFTSFRESVLRIHKH